MARYVWRGEGWVDRATGAPMESCGDGIVRPTVWSDLPAYISPVTRKPVEGRSARREDLARSGSRPVDPSEWRPVYHNKQNAERARGEYQPRPKPDLGEGYMRQRPRLA